MATNRAGTDASSTNRVAVAPDHNDSAEEWPTSGDLGEGDPTALWPMWMLALVSAALTLWERLPG